ncbi:Rad2 nuclease [Dissophora globulifera]|uniref:Rad2 nuclease n=1 Tax=Dissophora globulifera TaxID=979702 RepID=A0A9P6RD29_9FUNG|nr:Rad2 nuclease [Dissophora globulifera]
MGIQGLLPLLKSIEKPVHLKDYAGLTLAVDGYVWLHKGAFACAQELCLGQPTQKYVAYFMRKIEMFKFFGVKPYIVFDGGYLPSKAATEQDRLGRREESKKQAMDLHHSGKTKQALEQFRKCVDVTPEMAYAVIQALKAAQVDYVVAPYEADAQLAYLEKKGIVDGIVTEDSDLLVFGCQRVIFKLDQYGVGIEIRHDNLSMVRDISFHDWTMTDIRHMCILAGCDYLPSIPGMGLKTAQRLLRRYKTFERAIKHIRMENTGTKIPTDYENAFRRADLTFLYARVYDPTTKSMAYLNAIPEELEEFIRTEEYDFLGPVLEDSVLQGIASGILDPISKAALRCPTPLHAAPKFSLPVGKENKPLFNNTSQSMPASTKSIHAYFTKATPPTSNTNSQLKGGSPKKALLNPTVTDSKKRPLEKFESPPLAKKSVMPVSVFTDQRRTQVKENTQDEAVVEARSRFFGTEIHLESNNDAKTTSWSQLLATREDSGIGLDEALLMYDALDTEDNQSGTDSRIICADFSEPKPLLPEVTLSSNVPGTGEPTHKTAELCTAEAKVIQGWRDKFSNPSGALTGRPLGLTRAFQASSSKSKTKAAHISTKIQPTMSRPSAIGSSETPRGAAADAVSLSTGGMARTTPGHLAHHAKTTNPPGRSTSRSDLASRTVAKPPGSSLNRIESRTSTALMSEPLSQVTRPNLDRFKYSPATSLPTSSLP